MKKINRNRKLKRKARISNNIIGSKDKPRLSVFRSNRYIYTQVIDDGKKITLVSFTDLILKKSQTKKINKTMSAKQVGIKLAEILKAKEIKKLVFDRNIYAYKGRVKALADGLREGGIKI